MHRPLIMLVIVATLLLSGCIGPQPSVIDPEAYDIYERLITAYRNIDGDGVSQLVAEEIVFVEDGETRTMSRQQFALHLSAEFGQRHYYRFSLSTEAVTKTHIKLHVDFHFTHEPGRDKEETYRATWTLWLNSDGEIYRWTIVTK